LYVQYLKNPCSLTKERYTRYKNKLTHLLRISEKKYIREYLDKYSTDLKKSWSVANNIIGKNSKCNNVPVTLNINGEKVNDPLTIANTFNSFLSSVGPNLAQRITKCGIDPLTYISESKDITMYLKPVNIDELDKVIRGLKSTGAGHDGIKPAVIRAVKNCVLEFSQTI